MMTIDVEDKMIRLRGDLYARLVELAEREHRSAKAQLDVIVERALADEARQQQAQANGK